MSSDIFLLILWVKSYRRLIRLNNENDPIALDGRLLWINALSFG